MPVNFRVFLVICLMLAAALLAQAGHNIEALVPVVVACFAFFGSRRHRASR